MGKGWTKWLTCLGRWEQVNPVLLKELRVTCRRPRHYALRTGYLVLLTLLTLAAYRSAGPQSGPVPVAQFIHQQAQIGQGIVSTLVTFQWVALQFLAVVVLASCFQQEVQRRTFHSLLTSPLDDFQIVAGKLGAGAWQMLILLACALPLLGVVMAIGGVDWGNVTLDVLLTATCILSAGAMSVFFSTWFIRPAAVIFASLAFIVGWNLLPAPAAGLLLLWLIMPCLGRPRKAERVFQRRILVAMVSPAIFLPLGWHLRYGFFDNFDRSLADALFLPSPYTSPAARILWTCIDPGATLVCHLSLLLLTFVLLWRARAAVAHARMGRLFDRERRVAPRLAGIEQTVLALEAWSTDQARRAGRKAPPPAASRRGLLSVDSFRNPIVWRDARSLLPRLGPFGWLLLLPAVALLLLALLLARLEASYETGSHNFLLFGPHTIRVPDPRTVYPLIALVFLCAILLLAALQAARSVAGPRESRTWDELLATPLSTAAIATGKCLAVLVHLAPALGVFLLGLLLTFPPESGIVPAGLAMAVAGALFVCTLGLYVGTRAPTSGSATVTVLLVLLALWAVSPFLLHDLLAPLPGWEGMVRASESLNPPLQFYYFAQTADPSPLAPPPAPRSSHLLASLAVVLAVSFALTAAACRRFRGAC